MHTRNRTVMAEHRHMAKVLNGFLKLLSMVGAANAQSAHRLVRAVEAKAASAHMHMHTYTHTHTCTQRRSAVRDGHRLLHTLCAPYSATRSALPLMPLACRAPNTSCKQ